MSIERSFSSLKTSHYQSLYLLRLVLFEPLYVSLQPLPYFQISFISLIQLTFTAYSIYCVFKRCFYNWVFAVFRLATEAAILFFLVMGVYCQFSYGKATTEEYFSDKNSGWLDAQ